MLSILTGLQLGMNMRDFPRIRCISFFWNNTEEANCIIRLVGTIFEWRNYLALEMRILNLGSVHIRINECICFPN
jgi:hypothetical protein